MTAPPTARPPGHLRRWGLRRRVTVAFGLLSLVLSLVLAAVAWALVTQSVLRDARAAALTAGWALATAIGQPTMSRAARSFTSLPT